MKDVVPNKPYIQPDPMPLFLWVSLFLFVLGMIFPAFYSDPAHRPIMTWEFFAYGWLRLLDLDFQWFVIHLYGFAIVTVRRSGWSFLFALGALLLTLSILHDEKIRVVVENGYYKISAYGWGYCLWVLALTVLTVGQLLRTLDGEASIEVKTLIHLGCFGAIIYQFVNHHYLDHNNHYSRQKEREVVFESYCTKSNEVIFRKVNLKNSSIYLARDSAPYFMREKERWNLNYGIITSQAKLKGVLGFYETKNVGRPKSDQIENPYLVVKKAWSGIPISEISSEYELTLEQFEFPKSLDLLGGEATIMHLQSKEIIARSSYIYDKQKERFCGNSENGRYSVGDFLVRVLGG